VTPVERTRRTSSTPVCASIGVRTGENLIEQHAASARSPAPRNFEPAFSDGISSLASTLARPAALRIPVPHRPCGGASRITVVRISAPTMTSVDHRHGLKAFHHLKVRAMPRWQRSAAGSAVTSSPSNQTRTLSRRQHTGDQG